MGIIALKICRLLFTASFMLMFLFSFSLPLIKAADAYTLTVINTKVGSGNVNGSDNFAGSINCTLGPLEQCSSSLSGEVTLLANTDWKSVFEGWGAPCSGTGSCVFTLIDNTGVSAVFSPNYQALVVGHTISPEFTTLTDAYSATSDQSTVAANIYTFHEDLILSQAKFVRLYLGKEPGFYYAAPIGFTTLHGYLEVQLGSVEIDSLIIE